MFKHTILANVIRNNIPGQTRFELPSYEENSKTAEPLVYCLRGTGTSSIFHAVGIVRAVYGFQYQQNEEYNPTSINNTSSVILAVTRVQAVYDRQ